jgi:hypothetical protein
MIFKSSVHLVGFYSLRIYFIDYCLLLAYNIQRIVPVVGLCCPLDADRILSFIGPGTFGPLFLMSGCLGQNEHKGGNVVSPPPSTRGTLWHG